ncbi:MAG TPA: hypothetical protein DIW51_10005 [Rhodospirillaceae bacterium]|nr:hypothetical protein [Rhodospirillaceae bacterium]
MILRAPSKQSPPRSTKACTRKTQAIRDADRVRLMDEYNIFALMARLAEHPVKTAPQALILAAGI